MNESGAEFVSSFIQAEKCINGGVPLLYLESR